MWLHLLKLWGKPGGIWVSLVVRLKARPRKPDEEPMTPRRPEISPAEAGFALIEVLVSAAVVVVVSAGTFGLLQAMTRASGDQRHSSQAFALSQEDQARLRSM